MKVLFESIKGLFFLFSILIGFFLLRGNYILTDETFNTVTEILKPGYLVFVGLIIGYIIASLWIIKNGETDKKLLDKVYIRSFIIGLIIGIILAIIYTLIP